MSNMRGIKLFVGMKSQFMGRNPILWGEKMHPHRHYFEFSSQLLYGFWLM